MNKGYTITANKTINKGMRLAKEFVTFAFFILFLPFLFLTYLLPKGKELSKSVVNVFFHSPVRAKGALYLLALPLILGVSITPFVINANASDTPTELKEVNVKSTSTNSKHDRAHSTSKKEIAEATSTPKHSMGSIITPNDYRGEFIKTILKDAIEVGKEYNVYPSVIMAQAIIESDWGRSGLTKRANNYFGVKAKAGQPSVTMLTQECYDGVNFVTIEDQFAAYSSARGPLEGNASLLRNGFTGGSDYYSGAWRENAKTYADSARSLTNKYATDPNYGTTLISVIETYGLNYAD